MAFLKTGRFESSRLFELPYRSFFSHCKSELKRAAVSRRPSCAVYQPIPPSRRARLRLGPLPPPPHFGFTPSRPNGKNKQKGLHGDLTAMAYLTECSDKPLLAIVGGGSLEPRLKLIDGLLDLVDTLAVGGGLAATFIAAAAETAMEAAGGGGIAADTTTSRSDKLLLSLAVNEG